MRAMSWRARSLVLVAVTVLTASMILPAASGHGGLGPASGAAPTAPGSAVATATPTVVRAPAASPSVASPHPGTLDIYNVLPGGANTVDPAEAYDTASYEPILNVYETLINYNGSSTDSFVPVAATCVPGTPQCVTDYGFNMTGARNGTGFDSSGVPISWTFVIDPAARFYDPSTGVNWSMYPTDVFFSIARTLAFGQVQGSTSNSPGWILSQTLLPYTQVSSWDAARHPIWNNTPGYILDSMLINDTSYCPASAMDGVHGNGCITFLAEGSSQEWPYFLEIAEFGLGSSIVPCGWFSYKGAGLPNWLGTNATHGDGSCVLPNGGTSTNTTSWDNYVTNAFANPRSWDLFEAQADNWPTVQPNVYTTMVGSGPYYGSITGGSLPGGTGYQLAANPAYAEPSGCSGANGLAKYVGYCNPAPGAYIPNVKVFYDPDDSLGISQYNGGQADFAAIEQTHAATMLSLAAAGKLNWMTFPTISNFFTPIDLAYSETAYTTTFASQPAQNIPYDFFSHIGIRHFYVGAYPYLTVQNTVRTVSGIDFTFNAGGPIPYGMGNYYPTNVSFPGGDPYHPSHDPDLNPSHVGSAAWWWAQVVNNTSSPYYNASIDSKCTAGSPCKWAIAGLQGDPADDVGIDDWIGMIEKISQNRLQPFRFDLTFVQFLTIAFRTAAFQNPLISEAGSGWAPDYPDPTDYVGPIVSPYNLYTEGMAWGEMLLTGNTSLQDNATCGHYNTASPADLGYWSAHAQAFNITEKCQGVAYAVASGFMQIAGGMPDGPQRVLYYNEIEQITNALSMYVWNGQSNQVASAAPWINLSSINQNPVIGGGGDNYWFHIKYATGVSEVVFNETGLPAGTDWSVTIGTVKHISNTSTLFFTLPNGSHGYTLGGVPGYTGAPTSGTVTVSGANVAVDVAFTQVKYKVSFEQSTLPASTSWSVTCNGNTLTSSGTNEYVNFTLPNGTYSFTVGEVTGYTATPGTGTVTVNGADESETIVFAIAQYTVTFGESGLASGTSWGVTFNAVTHHATAPAAITFQIASGTYSYNLSAVANYAGAPTTGSVTVNNADSSVGVVFEHTYPITFTQTGLPAGTSWSVTVNGVPQTSTATTIVFNVVNGVYSYTVGEVSGYSASPAYGTITVSSSGVSPTVSYSKPTTTGFLGLSGNTGYYLVGGIVAAVVVIAAVVLVMRSRSRKGGGAPPSEGPPKAPPPEEPFQ